VSPQGGIWLDWLVGGRQKACHWKEVSYTTNQNLAKTIINQSKNTILLLTVTVRHGHQSHLQVRDKVFDRGLLVGKVFAHVFAQLTHNLQSSH
jgi:hypothetical protein